MKSSLRFSLGTFLLLLTVIVLAISHYNTSRQLSAVRRALIDYRYEYGHLVVDDRSRPHLLRYTKQENPWKWHAYFPVEKKYKLMFGVGNVPNSGPPEVSQLKHVQSTMVVGTGDVMPLFVSLEKHDDDSMKLSIGCEGAQTVAAIIPKWYSTSSFNISRIGYREPFSTAAEDQFVIFRYTERTPNPPVVGSPTDQPSEEGVVVWAVPVE